jgi:hypothetical protein
MVAPECDLAAPGAVSRRCAPRYESSFIGTHPESPDKRGRTALGSPNGAAKRKRDLLACGPPGNRVRKTWKPSATSSANEGCLESARARRFPVLTR